MAGARMCGRCGTRVDEMRNGWSPVCVSCGNPLPPPAHRGAAASGGGSSALWWIVGLLGVIAVIGVATLAIVAGRASRAATTPVSGPAVAIETQPAAVVATTPDAAASASAAPVAAPLTAAELDEIEGNYRCAMDDTAAFPCRIQNSFLEKLGGSQRFKGPITKLGNGNFSFSGTFFCPFGDCTHPVATTFVRQAPGKYVGKFGPNDLSKFPGGGPGNERVVLTKVR